MKENYVHADVSEQIIRAYYTVYNKLGYGFLEKVYENAMAIELEKMGLLYKTQQPVSVRYEGRIIGKYITDIIVADCIIVEIKAAESLLPEHEAQLINYLRATHIEVGLLLNFGRRAGFKRKVFSAEYKNHV
jgi:GxxExxY protein